MRVIGDFIKMIFMPVDALLGRAAAVAGAVCAAQFPNVIVLYLQRLGGHIDELKLLINQYQLAAQASGKTLQEFIAVHTSSKVPEIMKTGELIQSSLERYSSLKNSYDAIMAAKPLSKFFVFVGNIDLNIFKATVAQYTFGFPINKEGLLYAAAGMVAGMILYYLLKKLIVKLFEPLFTRKAVRSNSDIVYK